MDEKTIRELIHTGDLLRFYKSTAWKTLRAEILQADRGECQGCKARGKYTKATTVHHVNHVKLHPELALSRYYKDDCGRQKRQLVSLCHECHEEAHGHRRQTDRKPLTEEKW